MFHVEHQGDVMRNILILFNASAGKKKQVDKLYELEKMLKDLNIKYSIDTTLYSRYIIDKYKNNYDLPYTDVISCGGDGTLFETVNAFADKNVTISVFPVGTGNDYYRNFNSEIDYIKLIVRIIENKYKEVDLIKVNDYYSINGVGMGLDAYTAKKRNDYNLYNLNTLKYPLSAISAISTFKPLEVKINVDGKEFEREIMMVTINSGKYYGGGMIINPQSVIDDGLGEMLLLKKCSKMAVIKLLKDIYNGTHINNKYVEVYRGKEFIVEPIEKTYVHIEGELVDINVLKANVEKKKIRVIV